jgi:hypothetical protein
VTRCPYCAEEIQDEAIACKHCRRDLTESHDENLRAVYAGLSQTRSAELQAFWSRFSIQSAVTAGLLFGALAGFDTLNGQPVLALAYSVVGALNSFIWLQITRAGYRWIDIWNKELRSVEERLGLYEGPDSVKAAFCRLSNYDPDLRLDWCTAISKGWRTFRRTIRSVFPRQLGIIEVRPWAFLMVWLFFLTWLGLAGLSFYRLQ